MGSTPSCRKAPGRRLVLPAEIGASLADGNFGVDDVLKARNLRRQSRPDGNGASFSHAQTFIVGKVLCVGLDGVELAVERDTTLAARLSPSLSASTHFLRAWSLQPTLVGPSGPANILAMPP